MRADLDQAARGLESFFVRQLMKEALPDLGGDAQFGAMLQDALADEVAKSGGLGVSTAMLAQLDPGAVLAHDTPKSHVPPARALGAYGISSGFGARVDPITGHRAMHHGIDVPAPEGRGVRAAFDGTVARVDRDAGGYGQLVVVDHGGGLESRYAHLSAAEVVLGQRVSRGETIGAVGSTGRSTGPHLHFELRKDGAPVDSTSRVEPRQILAGDP